MQQAEKKRKKEVKMNKTRRNTGPSLWACTHVRTRAYIRGLRSLRQSINTHDATGEAGRRVRVSQRFTPPLSLHLFPFVSPASLLVFLLLRLYICNCSRSYAGPFSPRKTQRSIAWQEKLWPPVGVRRDSQKKKKKKRASVNKTRQPVTPSQKAAFRNVLMWHRGFHKTVN